VTGRILVLGAGDVGSAVAHALVETGHRVALADTPRPPVLRRGMAFCDALFDRAAQLAGVEAWRCDDLGEVAGIVEHDVRRIAITALPLTALACLSWDALVDARMRKHSGPEPVEGFPAPLVGLGPGFVAGENCTVAVETSWTAPGMVVRRGPTLAQAGAPRTLGGVGRERLVTAHQDGVFATEPADRRGGARRGRGGNAWPNFVSAPLSGVLRGLVRDGVAVRPGTKLVEVDPRGVRATASA
jgi:xanthine dehydrogenase accessory factor